MARVWIVQLLCPKRHCIMGLSYEEGGELNAETCEALIGAAMKESGFRHRCGICGSTALVFENAPTRFMSMEEARPHLERVEAENILSRMQMDALGLTADVKEFDAAVKSGSSCPAPSDPDGPPGTDPTRR